MEQEETTVQITAEPKRSQLVEHEGQVYKTIQEGKAFILVPPGARTSVDPQAKAKGKAVKGECQVQNVFYNPIQQFNRDLSVLAIKAFAEDACDRKKQHHAIYRGKAQKKWERKQLKKQNKKKEDEVIQNEDVGINDKPHEKPQESERTETPQNENKRKRDGEEDEDEERSGRVKLQKTNDGPPVVATANGSATHMLGQDASVSDVSEFHDSGIALTDSEGANDAAESLPVEAGPAIDPPDSRTEDAAEAEEASETQGRQEWQPTFRILDALSATGLRALRYASEIPFKTEIVATDRDRNAVKNIDMNVQHNRLNSSITTSAGDAQGHMYRAAYPSPHSHGPQHVSGKYDVIDLDPYGTAAPFIDAALQALDDGGLLCVTCTDSGVFASCGYSEKTFALYGGMPIKGSHSHEGGLRLVLHSIATRAAAYGISIEPLLSLSIDFYVRLFVRVHKSPRDVKFLAGKTMIVYGCDHGCGAWSSQFLGRHTKQSGDGKEANYKYLIGQAPSVDKRCEHCGSIMHVAGPMWGGPLHNPAFVEKVLQDLETIDEDVYQTKSRIEGMLNTALDELIVNSDSMDFRASENSKELVPQTPPESRDHHPFFFIPSALCKVIKAQAPPENLVKGALRHAGYRATRSHCKGGSIKTDAPWWFLWEVMREWVRQKAPIKEGALKEESAGWKILQAMRKVDEEGQGHAGAENATNGEVNEPVDGVSDAAVSANTSRKEVVFDEKLGKDKPGKRLVRYQMNPRENWGPMARARGHA